MRAERQKATQDLRAARREGQILAIGIRSLLKAGLGPTAQELVAFGIPAWRATLALHTAAISARRGNDCPRHHADHYMEGGGCPPGRSLVGLGGQQLPTWREAVRSSIITAPAGLRRRTLPPKWSAFTIYPASRYSILAKEMLVIRREQMAAFREAQKQRFKARVARALVASHPTELGSMSAGELRSLVDSGVQRAEAYGLDTEASIRQYLEFMAVRGLGFEERSEYAWAGIVLARTDLHADLRVQQLQAIAALLERR